MQRVVMFRLGRDNMVVDVSTDNILYETALRIVKERFDLEMYPMPSEPENPGFTVNQLKKFGEFPKIVELGKTLLSEYNAKKKVYDVYKEAYDIIVKAIKGENGVEALEILNAFKKKEGHQFDVFDVMEEYGS